MNTLTNRNKFFRVDPFGDFDDFFKFGESRQPIAPIMRADILDQSGDYVIEIELAGYSKSEIDIKLEKGYLQITAKKGKKEETSQSVYIRRERFSGAMTRKFYVGEELETSDIKASFDSGILQLKFPKEVAEKESTKSKVEIS